MNKYKRDGQICPSRDGFQGDLKSPNPIDFFKKSRNQDLSDFNTKVLKSRKSRNLCVTHWSRKSKDKSIRFQEILKSKPNTQINNGIGFFESNFTRI